jgi:hypothetical protein
MNIEAGRQHSIIKYILAIIFVVPFSCLHVPIVTLPHRIYFHTGNSELENMEHGAKFCFFLAQHKSLSVLY